MSLRAAVVGCRLAWALVRTQDDSPTDALMRVLADHFCRVIQGLE